MKRTLLALSVLLSLGAATVAHAQTLANPRFPNPVSESDRLASTPMLLSIADAKGIDPGIVRAKACVIMTMS